MHSLKIPDRNALVSSFQWRKKGGAKISPCDMETSHLFYTTRMIWNNTVQSSMRVGEIKLYTFSPEYTPSYMKLAVRALLTELASRPDLEEWMLDELNEMLQHLRSANLLTDDRKE